uniref:Anoctamin n=1 Tax=Electrophorus electricus TaxID=8005 RepID=A0A4W4E5L8_ELEEL
REPLLSEMPAVRLFDCILVACLNEDEVDPMFKKREAFINELKSKKMKVTKIMHDNKVFYGIRAPEEIFEKFKYLLKVSDSCNWSIKQKDCIPHITSDLLKQDAFETLFYLHELYKCFVTNLHICTYSPSHVDLLTKCGCSFRDYFGEKVALYFLWLGWYTLMLIPAAIIGVVVFLYAIAFFSTDPLIKEVCESNIIMCPSCDKKCQVWQLSDTCGYAKMSHLFDNEGTVAFAMFMAIWATVFLELWKRHRSLHVTRWNVYDWCEDEEELILMIVNDPHCKPKDYKRAYLQNILVILLGTLVLLLIIGMTHVLVIFRVWSATVLAEAPWKFLSDYSNVISVMLGAVLHYFIIQFMTHVNKFMALKLIKMEKLRSGSAKERSFTVKMFTFQFFTLFSSLIYVAFFLGRINGYPGNYVRIAGKLRLEECHPSGCLTDLFIQMAVIMLLKQTVNNIIEFTVPWFKRFMKRTAFKKELRNCGNCYRKACRNEGPDVNLCEICNLRDWLRNYNLSAVDAFSLFNEYLEMVIQFSFTTIFVAAFPLAPLFALINNIFEIRLDAIKMLRLGRRIVPNKANDIGVWTPVLEVIGVMAVIANGLVIGISSDFVPRLVYRYHYGPCANVTSTDIQCMEGFIAYTLSTAYMSEESVRRDFVPSQMITPSGLNVTQCSYRDYRNDDDHSLTSQFWLILAARFAFVILFEHVILLCKFLIAWFVPDNPIRVKNHNLHDRLTRLKHELQEIAERFDSKSTDV